MEQKSAMQMILENSGTDEFEARPYLYGETCLGVTTGGGNLGRLFALIVESADEDNREELGETLRSMATDSMGRGTIVYFPGTPYVGEEEDEDGE